MREPVAAGGGVGGDDGRQTRMAPPNVMSANNKFCLTYVRIPMVKLITCTMKIINLKSRNLVVLLCQSCVKIKISVF